MADSGKTALIVGASRGLGLGLVREHLDRGWQAIATTRGRNDDGLRKLATTAGDRLRIETLDVNDAAQIEALKRSLDGRSLDLLFASAGISNGSQARISDVSPDDFTKLMLTNALAPLKIIEALGDRVPPTGAIVAMSSILGSVAENTSGSWEAYRASKAALNTLLRSYAARHQDRSIIAMHPGWVRTDMGGPQANVEIEDSVKGMADVIETRLGKPGCVYLDYKGRTIAW